MGTNKLHIWINVCPALSEVKSLCLVLIALRRNKQGQTCLGMGWYLATGKWQHHHHVSWNISSAGALCCTTRAKEKSRLRRDIKCAEDMISLHPVNVIDECWILSFYYFTRSLRGLRSSAPFRPSDPSGFATSRSLITLSVSGFFWRRY